MQHPILITEEELNAKADYADSRSLVPELILRLIAASIKNPTELRLPIGGSVGQPGWDGIVVSPYAFEPYVPEGPSYWEVGTGANPCDKATKEFTKRTRSTEEAERKSSTFVFVTPRSASDTWSVDRQREWLKERRANGDWRDIRIIDGTKLVQWFHLFPGIEFWLAEKLGIPTKGVSSPLTHWDNLRRYGSPPDLSPGVFLAGRQKEATRLLGVFRGETPELLLETRYPEEGIDFVTATLASLDMPQGTAFSGRCLIINDHETWRALCTLQDPHVFIASPSLDVLGAGAPLRNQARNKGHGVIFAGIPLAGRHDNSVYLTEAKSYDIEKALVSCGYSAERARVLSNRCEGRITVLKRLLLNIPASPEWASSTAASELAIAALIGQWDGSFEGDCAVIEDILGRGYSEWLKRIQPLVSRPDPPLTQWEEKWRFVSRFEGWQNLGPHLFNSDIESFKKQALVVLREKDPKFTLPPEERWKVPVDGKKPKYSDTLREGFAETLALLGTFSGSLKSCSVGKPESIAAVAVHEILNDSDWRQWASLNDVLPLLAEAAPVQFLDAIERILNDSDSETLRNLFAQEGKGFMGGWNYMSGILWALETLAWHQDYLARVTTALGHIAEIDPGGRWTNRASNSLEMIFMPWLPQTNASVSARKVAIEALLRESPDVAWRLLLAILPDSHQTIIGTRKPSWREFISSDYPETVSREEHSEQVTIYANMIIQVARSDNKKLVELIGRLGSLPPLAYSEVLEHLSSESVTNLSELERTGLWEALVNLVTRHRRFQGARWAMSVERLEDISEVAELLKPSSPSLVHRRLFSQSSHELMDAKNDFEEQSRQIEERRATAISEIMDYSGIEEVLDLARSAVDSREVGLALGRLAVDKYDSVILPGLLVHSEEKMGEVAFGYVLSRFSRDGWSWVDIIGVETWTDDQRAAFLVLLPFDRETWIRAKKLLGTNEALYWRRVEARPCDLKEGLSEVATRLIECGRARSAIRCICWAINQQVAVTIDAVYSALLAGLTSTETVHYTDRDACAELIRWLQNCPGVSSEILFQIEWSYLPMLDYDSGLAPKTLERRLADDPEFYCRVIQTVFVSERGAESSENVSEEQERVAAKAYHLLRIWRTPPGSKPDGSFDGTALKKWLEEVKLCCDASGHLRVGLRHVGRVLTYSPADPGGLWISKSAAEVLNEKEHDVMRTEFRTELFNRRGVHGWSAGEEERALAADFRRKADSLEMAGYSRLAASVRDLSDSYEMDASREASRDPFSGLDR